MRVAALALALAACVSAPQGPVSCNAAAAQGLVGRQQTDALGAEALRLSGAHRLRWIRPGFVVTMDYSADRLNLYLDPTGRIERLACG
jgi:hypothetical protein